MIKLYFMKEDKELKENEKEQRKQKKKPTFT